MIDLHCHVLPGIDDGPQTIEESLALARAARAAGTKVIVATPHVSWSYQNDAARIATVVEELNSRLEAEGIELVVLTGAEIAMTRLIDIDPAELSLLALGGGSWLLVEPPFTPGTSNLDALLLGLHGRGHSIVLAHPERCAAFHRDRKMLESVVGAGMLTSITAGSLVGRFGREVQRFAMGMVRDGLVHNVASDAHDCGRRPPGIAAELERAGLASLTRWLTCEVPEAILDGRMIPPRPTAASPGNKQKRWWRSDR